MENNLESGEYLTGFNDGVNSIKQSHEFIEKVIDAYLAVKNDVSVVNFMERHDFISLIIDKVKSI